VNAGEDYLASRADRLDPRLFAGDGFVEETALRVNLMLTLAAAGRSKSARRFLEDLVRIAPALGDALKRASGPGGGR